MASMIKPQLKEYEPFFKDKREFAARDAKGFPIGPKTRERLKHNATLRKLKINHCELKFKGICIGNKMLTWAHSLKSRFLVSPKDYSEAARACAACHQHAEEKMSHAEMKRAVKEAIAARKPPTNRL
jgi:hypothetical protein